MAAHPGNHTTIAIIGSGFGGLGAAIQLKQHGIEDFVIFERAGDVGGVWRDNQYPGCACDVQSHLYSFSFAPNPAWSHSYSPQPEIWAYLQRCVRAYNLMPHIRLHHQVDAATWDPAARHWRISTSQGNYTTRFLVAAMGGLSEPAIPELPGLKQFRGPAFHSARWDHHAALDGQRIAVIGTGASAIQFVPAIQPRAGRLMVFQRTPPWIIPRHDHPIGLAARRLYARFPLLQRAVRTWIYLVREIFVVGFRRPVFMRPLELVARRHLARAVPDPVLRAKLTPSYRIGCKRILPSNDYLPAIARPNVELVTERIAEIRERSIVTCDGCERPVDVIIFGTGFQVTDPPLVAHIRGRDGRSLQETWAGSPQAYLGTTVAGFPNLFLLQGPNTGLGHSSVLVMIEAQIAHVLGAITYLQRHGQSTIEPRPEAQAAFIARVDRAMRGTVWMAGSCTSWYLDATGRNSTLWPGYTWQFRRQVAQFDPGAYVFAGGRRP